MAMEEKGYNNNNNVNGEEGAMDDDDQEDDHIHECDDKVEKWANHYSSNHQILLVGDGDFSFSLSLARSFGSACNLVATSLDPYDVVIRKYKEGKSNWESLERLGASLLQDVDATVMKTHPDLRIRKFDRIIFNFPHAGFRGREDNVLVIRRHKKLIDDFFWNARSMLQADGEIHVNHKTTAPFSNWNLEEMASLNSLVLIERVEFKIEDYPGYKQKRGDGRRCDEPFPLGESSTFKFRFSLKFNKKRGRKTSCLRSMRRRRSEKSQVQNLSGSFDFAGSHMAQNSGLSVQRSPSFESSYPHPGHGRETNFTTFPQCPLFAHDELAAPANVDMPAMFPGRTLNHDTYLSPEFGRRTSYNVSPPANEFSYDLSLNRRVQMLPGPGRTETLRIVREYGNQKKPFRRQVI